LDTEAEKRDEVISEVLADLRCVIDGLDPVHADVCVVANAGK
jgi:hypothetical protein